MVQKGGWLCLQMLFFPTMQFQNEFLSEMVLQIQLQCNILYGLPDTLEAGLLLLSIFFFFYFYRNAWLNWEYVT